MANLACCTTDISDWKIIVEGRSQIVQLYDRIKALHLILSQIQS